MLNRLSKNSWVELWGFAYYFSGQLWNQKGIAILILENIFCVLFWSIIFIVFHMNCSCKSVSDNLILSYAWNTVKFHHSHHGTLKPGLTLAWACLINFPCLIRPSYVRAMVVPKLCIYMVSYFSKTRWQNSIVTICWTLTNNLWIAPYNDETQISWAVAEIKKISKLYGSIPKFLHCLRVNLSLRSKFFNQGFLKKCNF